MLRTQEEFLEWLGLKLGDRIEISTEYKVIKIDKCYYVQNHYNLHPISYLIGKEFIKLPAVKRVGNLKCDTDIKYCRKCPIRWLCDNHYTNPKTRDTSLFEILENLDITDAEVYEIFKKRLDKVVE